MNTTSFMDKQIMDLSQGSSQIQSKEFIDLTNHFKEEEKDNDAADRATHQIDDNGIKKEDIVPSYDFQPIRPHGASTLSSSYDSAPNLTGLSRTWNSDSKSNSSTPIIRNYGSLDSIEPAKVAGEKDRNAFDATILSEIDQTMKKYTDNLHHVLEGVSAQLTQLESRTHQLENSVDDLKVSVGNNHGSADGKMRKLENILREVQTGVQVLKDKQDIVEAQLKLAKIQVSKVEHQPESQTSVLTVTDPVQQAASAPQQSQQQFPSPLNLPQSLPTVTPPNAPPQPQPQPQPPSQHGLQPSVLLPNQFSQNQIPPVTHREQYFIPPVQSQETPSQQYQQPLAQQPHPPPGAPPHQQFQQTPQPQFPQPAPLPPQQQPSHSPVNPPQQQPPSLGHQMEEAPYPPQNYPPNLRQPPSGPPPSQQFYGAPPHVYDPPSNRSGGSGFSSGYGAPSGPPEPYHYGGSPPQYGVTSGLKPQLPTPPVAQTGGSGYPQLPTARVLPHALPTASGASGGPGSGGSGNRVPIDDVIDTVASMGFPRDHVRATVRKLTENGQSVDVNAVLDKLMNDGEIQPPRGGWFGR